MASKAPSSPKVTFKSCAACSKKIPSTDGHRYCLFCLGESHIPQTCRHCERFTWQGLRLREQRLRAALWEKSLTAPAMAASSAPADSGPAPGPKTRANGKPTMSTKKASKKPKPPKSQDTAAIPPPLSPAATPQLQPSPSLPALTPQSPIEIPSQASSAASSPPSLPPPVDTPDIPLFPSPRKKRAKTRHLETASGDSRSPSPSGLKVSPRGARHARPKKPKRHEAMEDKPAPLKLSKGYLRKWWKQMQKLYDPRLLYSLAVRSSSSDSSSSSSVSSDSSVLSVPSPRDTDRGRHRHVQSVPSFPDIGARGPRSVPEEPSSLRKTEQRTTAAGCVRPPAPIPTGIPRRTTTDTGVGTAPLGTDAVPPKPKRPRDPVPAKPRKKKRRHASSDSDSFGSPRYRYRYRARYRTRYRTRYRYRTEGQETLQTKRQIDTGPRFSHARTPIPPVPPF
uniref:Uncharacterized protein n=1 Tax=Pogona vitticeps TaxID=103695 RepID=A0ABM5GB21_9SAUR